MEVGQQWGRAQTMADGLTKLEAATGWWEDEDSCADPRDLGEWLQRLRPALSAFLLCKLRDPADLHDALQEASVRAWSSAEHTSELQSLMRCSYADFGLKQTLLRHRTTS